MVSDDVMAVLRGHTWPGNVRELENVIERALVLGAGSRMTLDDLPDSLKNRPARTGQAGGRRLADVEREHIIFGRFAQSQATRPPPPECWA